MYEDDGGTGDGNRTTTTTASSIKVVCTLKINITGGKGKGGESAPPLNCNTPSIDFYYMEIGFGKYSP